MKDKKVKYIIYSLVLTLILATGFSVAFFTTRIINNNRQVTIKAGQLSIIFTDTTEINATNIKPDWNTSKTFTVENESNKVFYYNIYIKDLINTLVTEDYLQYKITSTNGYNMSDFKPISKSLTSSKFILAENISIDGNTTQEYTIEFRYVNDPKVDQSEDMGKNFSGQMMIEEYVINSNSLYSKLTKNYTIDTITDFSTPVGGTEIQDGYNSTGKIYKTGSDYYFRGNPSDNWVKFAGKYWRIIRSNSSEGTRLLYAGTSHDGQDGYINNTTYKWYSSYDNADYVQWSYASSTIGNALTSWYNSNITGTNANMVNTSVAYCNDTSVVRTSGSTQIFGAYGRVYTNNTPSYSCGTNSNTTHRKIGLMTADEVAYAGGVYGNEAPNTYYYRNSKTSGCTGSSGDPCSVTGDNYWWTMSPYGFGGTFAYVFRVDGATYPGTLAGGSVNVSFAVRPVITLKSNVLVSGSGTASDPYVPSL